MAHEMDIRHHEVNRATRERVDELNSRARAVSGGLTGAETLVVDQVDQRTGNASLARSLQGSAVDGDLVDAAVRHVQSISPALGFDTAVPVEFQPYPQALYTSAGAAAVHLQETVHGIRVFQAELTVRFTPNHVIDATVGGSLTPSEIADTTPTVSAVDAVDVAARYLAEPDPDSEGRTDQFGQPLTEPVVDLTGFQPTVQSSDNDAEHTTVIGAPPFAGPVHAVLIWFGVDSALRLGWEVIMALPDGVNRYRVIVDAHNSEVLYSHLLTTQVFARGSVAMPDGGVARQLRDFPLPLSSYPVSASGGLPSPFPRQDWIAADRTEGNDVTVHLNGGGTAQGTAVNGVITFNPASPTDNDQLRVTLSFFCNFMHDFLFLLRFREADGNFQQNNYGQGGSAGDRVDAIVHPGAVVGTANMFTPADGTAPTMNMGLVTSTNRHTALDSSVVFHEYTHGLTNRLVGAPSNGHTLDAIQSGSMGEGWSDYIACTINNTTVLGTWILNNTAGIRGFPYDANFPDNFGMLGTGRYTEVHNNGEIWCAALMELNRRIGAELAAQLVVDALPLTPSNPTYLQTRDAILTALRDKAQAENWSQSDRIGRERAAWEAFAKCGMGVLAQSGASTTLSGIVGDFTLPDFDIGWADNDLTALGGGPGAAETPIALLTQFGGEPATARVIYRAADGHLHEMSYTTDRSWADNDLTALGGGPGAAETPIALLTQFGGEPATARVIYRAADGHLHEMSYTTDRSWADNDLTALGGGPGAAETPIALLTQFGGEPATARVIYRAADGHLHEMSYTTDRSWADNDLTALGGGPGAAETPIALLTQFGGEPATARVIYRAADGHLHEMSYTTDRSWADNDLTALGGGPGAAETPIALLTQFGGEPATARVIYRAADGHLHEMSYTTDRSWADNDLTALGGGPGAAETPIALLTQFGGEPATARVIYRAADGHLHEMSYTTDRSWADNDLTALGGGPGAAETPIALLTQFGGEPATARVIYRAADGHLHEMSYTTDRSWADNDLTALGGGPGAAETPIALLTQFGGEPATARVIYRAADGHLHEMSYTDG